MTQTPNFPGASWDAEFRAAVRKILKQSSRDAGVNTLDLGTYQLEVGEGAMLHELLTKSLSSVDSLNESNRHYLVTTLRQYSSHLTNLAELPNSPVVDDPEIQNAINTICVTLTTLEPLSVTNTEPTL